MALQTPTFAISRKRSKTWGTFELSKLYVGNQAPQDGSINAMGSPLAVPSIQYSYGISKPINVIAIPPIKEISKVLILELR
jgi:hypothetical protein